MADFFENYISRTDFLNTDEPIPSDDPDDYEFEQKQMIENDIGESIDDEDGYDEDEELDELDDFEICVAKDHLSFECYCKGCPHLNTNMVVMDDETKEYRFGFYFDAAHKNKLKELLDLVVVPVNVIHTKARSFFKLLTGSGSIQQRF